MSSYSHGRIRDNAASENTATENKPQVISLNPGSIEEMVRASSIVLHGTVIEINEVVDPNVEMQVARRTNTRSDYVATVRIKEIYKGGYPEDELSVEFKRSNKTESIPLLNMFEGEEVILFLAPGQKPPHFAPVSLTNGKIPFNSENDGRVKEIAEGPDRDPGKVTINLSVSKETKDSITSVFATVMIMNNTRKPIRVDSTLSPSKIFTITTSDGSQMYPIGNLSASSPEYSLVLPQHFIGARYNLKEFYELPSGKYFVRANFMDSGWSPDKSPDIITSRNISFEISD